MLQAASEWSAQASNSASALAAIEQRLGLPPNKPDDAATLERPAGALDWHYRVTLEGYPYEVLVLDSRTMRDYPARSHPEAVRDDMLPPGLVSSDALGKQIDASTIPTGDGVTLVVAPGPVLGVPWIEEKQIEASGEGMWELDAEAWGTNQNALQTLLARLAMRRTRVVILSGDVHYGFAARLRYWAWRPWGYPAQPHRREAVLVQLTASSLKNQGKESEKVLLFFQGGTLALHNSGLSPSPSLGLVTPAVDDWVGWSRSLRSFSPTELSFRNWGRRDPWWRKTSNRLALYGTPLMLHLPPPIDARICVQEDWRYQISFLAGIQIAPNDPSGPVLEQVPVDRRQAIKATEQLTDKHRTVFAQRQGRELVGVNNIGEITFRWGEDSRKTVVQQLWWRIAGESAPIPMTRYEVSLDVHDPSDPEPETLQRFCPE